MTAFEMVGNKLLLSGDMQPRRLKAVTEPCDRGIVSVTSQNRFPVVIRVFCDIHICSLSVCGTSSTVLDQIRISQENYFYPFSSSTLYPCSVIKTCIMSSEFYSEGPEERCYLMNTIFPSLIFFLEIVCSFSVNVYEDALSLKIRI